MAWDAAAARLCDHVASSGSKGVLEQGWSAIDGALGTEWARSLAAECRQLEEAKLLQPHRFEFADAQSGERCEYRHDGRSFVDLDRNRISAEVAAATPLLAAFAARHAPQLAVALASRVPSLGLVGWVVARCADLEACSEVSDAEEAVDAVQVKLQLTRGVHGCAPWHFDTSTSASSRQLTLLIYLSEDWADDMGGELQLQPFLQEAVSFRPSFDRGILFLADRLLHRSLPPRGRGAETGRWLLT
ncbi:unnamed protein product, partial [Polarella glacialis]